MEKWFQQASQLHNKWIALAINNGAKKQEAEDIVQQMYINLFEFVNKERNPQDRRCNPAYLNLTGDDILLNEEGKLKEYYVVKTLKNLVKKQPKSFALEWDDNIDIINETTDHEEFSKLRQRVCDALNCEHWYFEKIYNYYTDVENPSIRDLAEKIGLSHFTIFRDVRKIKLVIKENPHIYQEFKQATA